ncbi:MAG TPA: KTSC domain-containing protein [Rhizomicrobium sp.]|nr:KTSC domain-containing protein [Rhizomicrobium sp.]
MPEGAPRGTPLRPRNDDLAGQQGGTEGKAVTARRPEATSSMPSTVIRSFRYHASAWELEIEFVSGRCYRYLNVPPDIAAGMCEASSRGRYFNSHIRDHYDFVAAA